MYVYIVASLLQRWYTSEEHTKKLQNIEKRKTVVHKTIRPVCHCFLRVY